MPPWNNAGLRKHFQVRGWALTRAGRGTGAAGHLGRHLHGLGLVVVELCMFSNSLTRLTHDSDRWRMASSARGSPARASFWLIDASIAWMAGSSSSLLCKSPRIPATRAADSS